MLQLIRATGQCPLQYHTLLIYENEEEDVSSYWTKFWTRHYDGNLNKKQQIDLFGELPLEWTMDGTDVKHWGGTEGS